VTRQYITVMSRKTLEAYDAKKRDKVPMLENTIQIWSYATSGGSFRYRASGKSADGVNLSVFVNRETAMYHSNDGDDIKVGKVKPKGERKKRRSCKVKAQDAEAKCNERVAKQRVKRAAAKKPAKKTTTKKKATKKKAPKKKTTRKRK